MSKVWVFDLDDTLHNASAHIFPVMNDRMTHYIMQTLEMDKPAANRLRQHYWHVYGATLKGLMRHHRVDPHDFLAKTHALDLPNMVIPIKRLKTMLNQLDGRKCVFTNAPKAYAIQVLNIMGIADCFELVFSVESTQFNAKPNPRGFAKLLQTLNVKASDCIMLEDNLKALMTAKRLGMRTIWVSKQLTKPSFVDYRLNSVLALTHIKL